MTNSEQMDGGAADTAGIRTVHVDVRRGAYPVHIGSGIVGSGHLLRRYIGGESALIVTNDCVDPLYAERLQSALGGELRVGRCVLPDGEQHKNVSTWQRIFDAAVEYGCDRRTTFIALGGGVIGDMAGFAAATYQRGVNLIQAPTTLLAQVDAAVGGKTGVNHPGAKNMIGAFYQPSAVIADTSTLDTLPDREFRSGVAEVIKYGLLGDRRFFEWLEDRVEAVCAREPGALAEAIERSCSNKAAIVASDEHEHDQRALLNLGHTFAHAIEAGVSYSGWLHGEAVAVGLCMAAQLSRQLGMIDEAAGQRVEHLVARAGLPTRPPRIGRERMKAIMARDKKNRKGEIHFVLLEAIGSSRVVAGVSESALDTVLVQADGG